MKPRSSRRGAMKAVAQRVHADGTRCRLVLGEWCPRVRTVNGVRIAAGPPGSAATTHLVRMAALLSVLDRVRRCADPRLRTAGAGGPPGHHPGHPTACGGLPSSEPGLVLELMTCGESSDQRHRRRWGWAGGREPDGWHVTRASYRRAADSRTDQKPTITPKIRTALRVTMAAVISHPTNRTPRPLLSGPSAPGRRSAAAVAPGRTAARRTTPPARSPAPWSGRPRRRARSARGSG